MTAIKRILLVYKFDHPDVDSLKKTLAEQFPQYPLDLLNIKQIVISRFGIMLVNIFYMLKEYPLRQLVGYWKIWRRFWATTFIFKQVKRLVGEHVAAGNYIFTVQTHSDFDASHPSLPNFVYTDTTNLANLYTPGYSEEKLYSPAWRALEKTVYENAQVTFTRSGHIRHSIIEQYGIQPEKAVIAYAGCNTPVRDIDLGKKDYSGKDILFVGVTWERKGGPDLVRAFEQVLRKHPQAKLTIVGCSPAVDLPNVEIVGKIPVVEVEQYYRKASIFCLPTRLEPFGIVFIEAMSYGLPLVAPRTGAVPDLVEQGRNGYMFEPGDIDAMAAYLIELMDDAEKCRDFGRVGYSLVRERYTWQKVGLKMKASIQPVIQNWKAGS